MKTREGGEKSHTGRAADKARLGTGRQNEVLLVINQINAQILVLQ